MDKDFHLNMNGLSLKEIMGLLIRRSPGPLKDLGIKVEQQARNKLIETVPNSYKPEANQLIKRIYLDSGKWFSKHDSVPYLLIMEKAIKCNSRVHLEYQKKNGEYISREVAPYGLVAKMEVWYLIAEHKTQLRVYRVSRICGVKLSKKTFCLPENFDISAFWTSWCQEFENTRPIFPVTLHVTRDGLKELSDAEDYKITLRNQVTKKWQVICIEFETFDQALKSVLSLGSNAVVIHPDSLRANVYTTIKNLSRIYRL